MAQWISARLEFGAFYSYRVPNLSPSYSICSPVPSPAAIRLALVDAVIRHTGSVDEGKATFDLVKAAKIEVQPPERVAVMKFFIRRLKPEKPAKGQRPSVIQSTGIREYCLPYGAMRIWLESDEPDRVSQAFRWIRRLGTTDSLLFCTTDDEAPDFSTCLKSVDSLSLRASNFSRRAVFTLHELRTDCTFEQVNPYSMVRRAAPFEKRLFVLPLIRERAGGNWVTYRREPFDI